MAKSTKVKEIPKPELPITEVTISEVEPIEVPVAALQATVESNPAPIVIIPQVAEEKTDEQKIIDYIQNAHSEKVELSPILKSLYPVTTFPIPPKYLMQGESKRIKSLLSKDG